MNKVCVSQGNRKLGNIPSVSLDPKGTCHPLVMCRNECYAIRMMDFRSNIAKSWKRNTDIYMNNPNGFFNQVEQAILTKQPPYFRWHVGGDIPSVGYFAQMVDLASRVPQTKFVVFTKQFYFVGQSLHRLTIPNFRVMLSAWHNEVPSQEKAMLDLMKETRHMIDKVAVAWVENDKRYIKYGENIHVCSKFCPTCYQCWVSSGDILLHKH